MNEIDKVKIRTTENDSCIYTFTFCRKCKKIRDCLDTRVVTNGNYSFLCISCGMEENLIGNCANCGREGLANELIKHGNYCHLCEHDNIIECKTCGSEHYKHDTNDNVCWDCTNGKNKPCLKCGEYFPTDKLTHDNLCYKCALTVHSRLIDSNVNEVVDCIECGREVMVTDLSKGLCLHCKCDSLEVEIKRLKKRKAHY